MVFHTYYYLTKGNWAWLYLINNSRKSSYFPKGASTKNFSHTFANFLNICEKMMSADVRQKEIKDLLTYLTILCKTYLQNLKYNVNRGCIFHLILGGIPSTLILPIKNRGVRGFLNWQDDSPKWHLICLVNTICIHLINPSSVYNKINPSLV